MCSALNHYSVVTFPRRYHLYIYLQNLHCISRFWVNALNKAQAGCGLVTLTPSVIVDNRIGARRALTKRSPVSTVSCVLDIDTLSFLSAQRTPYTDGPSLLGSRRPCRTQPEQRAHVNSNQQACQHPQGSSRNVQDLDVANSELLKPSRPPGFSP